MQNKLALSRGPHLPRLQDHRRQKETQQRRFNKLGNVAGQQRSGNWGTLRGIGTRRSAITFHNKLVICGNVYYQKDVKVFHLLFEYMQEIE